MVTASSLAPETVRPLRRAEYERLVEIGSFEDQRIELLEGVLVEMSPQDAAHAAVISRLTRLLVRKVSSDADVRIQSPLAISPVSEPEPDVAVVPRGDHDRRHPSSAHLVIEVSAASLRKDREVKTRLYASAGIPEYWIVNLVDGVVEVHRTPLHGRYSTVSTHGAGDSVTLAALPSVKLRVRDILPRK